MKAIITDLDRTLLHTDKSISAYTADVLHQCRQSGMRVIIAVARPQKDLQIFREYIEYDAAVVTNGAIVLLPNKAITNCIPHSDAKNILSALCRIPDVVISMETSDGFFANADIPEWKPIVFNGFPALPSENEIYKILVSSKHTDILPMAQETLTDNTYLSVANGDLIQIMSRSATKWNGIQMILDHFGLPANDCIYFGDDYNDIEPLKNCGIGAAVLNAIEPAKRAADIIIAANDSNGVAAYIQTHFL